jgi:hypothetical protein
METQADNQGLPNNHNSNQNDLSIPSMELGYSRKQAGPVLDSLSIHVWLRKNYV